MSGIKVHDVKTQGINKIYVKKERSCKRILLLTASLYYLHAFALLPVAVAASILFKHWYLASSIIKAGLKTNSSLRIMGP